MVACGSDQGCTVLATAGVVALRRGMPTRENTGPGRKMPFPDGHYLESFDTQCCINTTKADA
jgi:hypothetical protein